MGLTVAAREKGRFCKNYAEIVRGAKFPWEAKRVGLKEGQVLLDVTFAEGKVKTIAVVNASDDVFATAAVEAVRGLECQAGRSTFHVKVPMKYILQ